MNWTKVLAGCAVMGLGAGAVLWSVSGNVGVSVAIGVAVGVAIGIGLARRPRAKRE